ncbi:MAG: bifunctional aldolase/short-chain dehydrogenase [bacterium]|nr:bifunctional aldolase/short-chain dehydrogenase [bacterium]
MKSLWNDAEAAEFSGELGQRVYTSRLLGRDPSLVLHGGGNTSLKTSEKNIFGEVEEILYVKGSGADLAGIEEADFASVRLAHLRKILQLDALTDAEMMDEMRAAMARRDRPAPSVEALLHAILPGKFTDHTHADAVIAITNTKNGLERIREIYRDTVVVVPYRMPGFALAKAAAAFGKEKSTGTTGLILMHHGVFSFGESARESYERMIELVGMAETYLREKGAWALPSPSGGTPEPSRRSAIAALRREISEAAGHPLLLSVQESAEGAAFARRDDLEALARKGPATPDHVLYTKRLPMIGRDAAAYRKSYVEYFEAHKGRQAPPPAMLDPAPRIVLDPELGLLAAGRTAREARVNGDIYEHTIGIILRAEALGGFRSVSEAECFDVEYWRQGQAKLRKPENPPPFTGEAALVTGAASGIGKACAASFLARGAAVVGLDINPAVEGLHDRTDYIGLTCDVTRADAVEAALDAGVRRFGGLDMLILNAGIFPASREIAALLDDEWRKVMGINLDANLALLRACHPLLRAAPGKGRVVVIGSKNVAAPGKGAAAYSASKAAVNQLARIAALEWAEDGIRVNSIHPDAVFDTGVWTPEVLASRAAHYGMTVEEYKQRNLLKAEITSRDVAEMAAEMCGPLFAKTTGAQVPLDGGDPRVI